MPPKRKCCLPTLLAQHLSRLVNANPCWNTSDNIACTRVTKAAAKQPFFKNHALTRDSTQCSVPGQCSSATTYGDFQSKFCRRCKRLRPRTRHVQGTFLVHILVQPNADMLYSIFCSPSDGVGSVGTSELESWRLLPHHTPSRSELSLQCINTCCNDDIMP